MNIISIVKSVTMGVGSKVAPLTAKLSAHAPEILLVSGLGCIGGGTVLACKKTLDAKEIVEEGMSEAEDLKAADAEQGEIAKCHISTGAKVARAYALPATLIVGGTVMVGMSHGIMNKRMLEAIGAANAYQAALEQYRKRVAGELGPSKELELYNGGTVRKEEVYQETEDGKMKKSKVEVKVRDDREFADPYMVRFAKDTSNQWQSEDWRNMDFIQTVQTWSTRRLMVEGRLFLRDVYRELGLKYRPIGAVAGWAMGNGDDCVIIDVDQSYSSEELEAARIECRPPVPDLWLKFNCEGNIVNIED